MNGLPAVPWRVEARSALSPELAVSLGKECFLSLRAEQFRGRQTRGCLKPANLGIAVGYSEGVLETRDSPAFREAFSPLAKGSLCEAVLGAV